MATKTAPTAKTAPTRTPARGMRTGRGLVTVEEPLSEGGRGHIDGWLLTVVAALCGFGAVMVYSASDALGLLQYNNPNYFFERQMVAFAIGLVGMVIAARMDYHRLKRFITPLTLGTLAALVLVLVPHLGTKLNGANRWFVVGPVSIQPSEVAAVVAIVVLSFWLSKRGPRVMTWSGVRDYAILVAILEGLIVLEKDLGDAIITGVMAFVLLALAGARKRHLAVLTVLGGLAGYAMIQVESYRVSRVACFSNPWADPLGCGFQPVQSLYGLGSGGIFGVGLGNSVEKYQWLPEANTDFIFAIIGEELGLIGTLCVVAAFLFLIWRGVLAAMRAPDLLGTLLAGGITAWIGTEAFVNIAAVTDLIPTTGVALPFISYGGTALIMTLVACGILCNVSSQGQRKGKEQRAYVDRWRRNGRSPDPGTGRRAGAEVG